MAFQALGELLPSRLKRAGVWDAVQTQKTLLKGQEVLRAMFPNQGENIHCLSIQDGVLLIRVHSPALATDIRLQQGSILQKCREARMQGIRIIRTIV